MHESMNPCRRSVPVALLSAALIALFGAAASAQCELELARLMPPDGQDGQQFGYRSALSGDVAVVGSPFDPAKGVNAGSAYVFERDAAGAWIFAAKLHGHDTDEEDWFGYNLAVDGDLIVVGAYRAGLDLTQIGAAYVFQRGAGGSSAWGEIKKLVPDGATGYTGFGVGVAIEGERIFIGAPNGGANGLAGLVYCYERLPDRAWSLAQTLVPSDATHENYFGRLIEVDGERLAVSTLYSDPSAGDMNGAIYVYERVDTEPWTEVAELTTTSPVASGIDFFAVSISLSGDTLIATAPNEIDPGFQYNGAVHVFVRDEASVPFWRPAETFFPAASYTSGYGLVIEAAIEGDLIVVPITTSDATGDVSGTLSVHGRNAGGANRWDQIADLSGTDEEDYFGYFAATFDAGRVMSGTTSDELAEGGPGVAYIFDLDVLARASWRNGGANPDSYSASPALLGERFVGQVDLATTGHASALLFGFDTATEITLAGGQVLLASDLGGAGELLRQGIQQGPLATFTIPVPNDAALCGLSVATQAAHLGGVQPLALSNAQDLTLGVAR